MTEPGPDSVPSYRAGRTAFERERWYPLEEPGLGRFADRGWSTPRSCVPCTAGHRATRRCSSKRGAGRVPSSCQDALVTAFATGSLLIGLPLLSDRLKELLEDAELRNDDSDSAVDLVVPINFNLPNLGKLMSLAFVPFAGWLAGATVGAEDFPMFLVSGLVSFFGEVIGALPFLLDLMRIPADMFHLFVAVDVFTGRFGTLLAGVHTVVLALLTAVALSGGIRLRWAVPGPLRRGITNANGNLVGFDAEIAHQLARDLGVRLEFVLLERGEYRAPMEDGRIDILMSGLAVTPMRATEVRFSEPVMDATLAFVVRDHERNRFNSRDKVQALERPRIAIIDIPFFTDALRRYLPNAELKIVESPREFFKAEEGEYDALFFTAEAGSGWTLVYPNFSVAIPKPDVVATPMAYAMPRGAEDLADYVDTWVNLKRKSGAIDRAYRYWIVGKGAEPKATRWSVIRDVLGWTATAPSTTWPQL